MAEGKTDSGLTMAVDVLALDFHVGAVAEHPFDHRRHLGGGTPLELRIDAGRLTLDMPVDHHPASAIARVPFRHQVAIPGSELGGIRTAGRARLAPDRRIADRQCRVGHACRCGTQRVRVDIAAVDMEQFVIADVADTDGDAFYPGIGPRCIERQQQPPVPVCTRHDFAAGGSLEAVQKPRVQGRFLEDIKKAGHRPDALNLALESA